MTNYFLLLFMFASITHVADVRSGWLETESAEEGDADLELDLRDSFVEISPLAKGTPVLSQGLDYLGELEPNFAHPSKKNGLRSADGDNFDFFSPEDLLWPDQEQNVGLADDGLWSLGGTQESEVLPLVQTSHEQIVQRAAPLKRMQPYGATTTAGRKDYVYQHSCRLCSSTFKKTSGVYDHMAAIHPGHAVRICNQCQKPFMRIPSFKAHIKQCKALKVRLPELNEAPSKRHRASALLPLSPLRLSPADVRELDFPSLLDFPEDNIGDINSDPLSLQIESGLEPEQAFFPVVGDSCSVELARELPLAIELKSVCPQEAETDSPALVCFVCRADFDSAAKLKRHMIVHSDGDAQDF